MTRGASIGLMGIERTVLRNEAGSSSIKDGNEARVRLTGIGEGDVAYIVEKSTRLDKAGLTSSTAKS